MSSKLIDWPSFAKAVGIHLILAFILLVGWEASSTPPPMKEVPPHIKAVVVEKPKPPKKAIKKPSKPKPVKKKPPAKKKREKKPKPKPKPKKPQPKKKVEPKKTIKKEPKNEPKKKTPSFDDLFAKEAKELLEDEKKQQKIKAEEDKRRKEEEQRRLEVEKQQAAEAQRIASELDTYKSLVQQTMRRYWKRPPVARENLVVKLSIKLLPGGEVNKVEVSESSGNAAFDRSAVTAVIKAGRFSVPSDPALFDKYFRSFSMNFNPNDM